ncbi:MAG: hypothetical protein AB9903_24295 [Vulcanimicrobiota bacterium]
MKIDSGNQLTQYNNVSRSTSPASQQKSALDNIQDSVTLNSGYNEHKGMLNKLRSLFGAEQIQDDPGYTPSKLYFKVSVVRNCPGLSTIRRDGVFFEIPPKEGENTKDILDSLKKDFAADPARSKLANDAVDAAQRVFAQQDDTPPHTISIESITGSDGAEGKKFFDYDAPDFDELMVWDLWSIVTPKGEEKLEYVNRKDNSIREYSDPQSKLVKRWS